MAGQRLGEGRQAGGNLRPRIAKRQQHLLQNLPVRRAGELHPLHRIRQAEQLGQRQLEGGAARAVGGQQRAIDIKEHQGRLPFVHRASLPVNRAAPRS